MSADVETAVALPSPDDLRRLHARLAEAVECDDASMFFDLFAASLVGELGAAGGAVWLCEPERPPRWASTQGVDPTLLEHFAAAVREVRRDGRGTILPPDERRNPTPLTAMLYPIRVGTTTTGVVLMLLPEAVREHATHYGRMLVPLCDFAAEFCYRHAAVAAPNHSSTSAADFALRVHAGLDPTTTAETIANEARRLLDCDRVGVAIFRRGRATALAFSGQDRFDPRSNLVRLWEHAATVMAQAGERVDFPTAEDTLAPQMESVLHALLDESHARRLVGVPLEVDEAVIGVMTVEWIAAARNGADDALDGLASLVPHAASALANAARHDALPLKLLGAIPGVAASLTAAKNLPKTTLLAGVIAALATALVLVPWTYSVEAPGTLQPVARRHVFATVDGTVDQILVRSGDRVSRGDPLVVLRSHDLDFAEADLVKRINENEQELLNAERLYNQGRTLSPEEQGKLPAEIAVLEQRRISLRREAELLAEKRNRLRVESPLDGQVATWNLVELLTQRPVRQGQALMELVAPEGEWEIEIRLPEDRLGGVLEAGRDAGSELPATFVMATDPGRQYSAQVVRIAPAAEQHAEEGNIVRLRASLDKTQLAELHHGADVRVRVHCGTRSLGYVMFRDVWAFVQSRVLFRL